MVSWEKKIISETIIIIIIDKKNSVLNVQIKCKKQKTAIKKYRMHLQLMTESEQIQ